MTDDLYWKKSHLAQKINWIRYDLILILIFKSCYSCSFPPRRTGKPQCGYFITYFITNIASFHGGPLFFQQSDFCVKSSMGGNSTEACHNRDFFPVQDCSLLVWPRCEFLWQNWFVCFHLSFMYTNIKDCLGDELDMAKKGFELMK